MTIQISDTWQRFIHGEVTSGRYASAEQVLEEALRLLEARDRVEPPRPVGARAEPEKRKPIWDLAAEIRDSVPREEWEKLPTDGAEQHDHYIYGIPKRPARP